MLPSMDNTVKTQFVLSLGASCSEDLVNSFGLKVSSYIPLIQIKVYSHELFKFLFVLFVCGVLSCVIRFTK